MENTYGINNNGVFVVKSRDVRMDTIMSRRPVVLEDTILDSSSKLNSIEVEALLDDDHFTSDVIPKQIKVEKMEDFIQEGQFGELNIVNGDVQIPEQEFQLENGNITIVSDVFHNSAGDTHIISDQEGEIESSLSASSFFEDTHTLEVPKSISEGDIDGTSTTAALPLNKEATDNEESPVKFEISSSQLKSSDQLSSSNLARKFRASLSDRDQQQIKIDKDDPRCRLHFVKFMKKDGKTIKIWECGICGKEFIHQYTLMRHLPTHTDERNYKCKHCGKAFRQLSTLAQHKATHSEFRPYVCDVCQKTFSRVSTLISHKKIHTESKIHVCHICGKGFHQKGNLKNHFFTHTNERPYKCDICGRGFNQTSNLQCHKLKTHLQRSGLSQSANKFKCSTCSESFSRRVQLRSHEEYVHVKNSFCKSSSSLRPGLMPSANALLKKKKMGNIRIIEMPGGDGVTEDKVTDSNLKTNRSIHKTGILIDPIDTKAMHKRLSQGLTPFALLKPAKSSPVVVKVQLCEGSSHMLVPASASELKLAGKFSVTNQVDGNRTVQIKVPVVATIHQRVEKNGEVHMDVEPPSDEETETLNEKSEEVENTNGNHPDADDQPILANMISSTDDGRDSTVVQHFIINPSTTKPPKDNLLVQEGEEYMIYMIPPQVNAQLIEVTPSQDASMDLLATAVNLTNDTPIKEVDVDSSVHYLRPTENHGEYEMVESGEGTFFTNSQGVNQQLKPLLDENEPVTVDQSHLTALMNVLQTAGYELQTDDDATTHQIILNSVDDAIIVDNQHVQMVINDQNDLSSVDVDSMQIEDVDSSTLSFAVQPPQ